MKVGDDLRRNDAKRDAIAAVTERKIGMRKLLSPTDVARLSLVSPNIPAQEYDTSSRLRNNYVGTRELR